VIKNKIFTHNIGDDKSYDIIFMEDVIRNIDIGIHDYEKDVPQRVSFDLYVKISMSNNAFDDDINNVVNYEYLIKILDSIIDNNRFSLLETLGKCIMEEVLSPNQVQGATLVISKLDILKSGKIGYSMTRKK
jgi:dihydroneopterin aldolase